MYVIFICLQLFTACCPMFHSMLSNVRMRGTLPLRRTGGFSWPNHVPFCNVSNPLYFLQIFWSGTCMWDRWEVTMMMEWSPIMNERRYRELQEVCMIHRTQTLNIGLSWQRGPFVQQYMLFNCAAIHICHFTESWTRKIGSSCRAYESKHMKRIGTWNPPRRWYICRFGDLIIYTQWNSS